MHFNQAGILVDGTTAAQLRERLGEHRATLQGATKNRYVLWYQRMDTSKDTINLVTRNTQIGRAVAQALSNIGLWMANQIKAHGDRISATAPAL
jgi:hypothetical protein